MIADWIDRYGTMGDRRTNHIIIRYHSSPCAKRRSLDCRLTAHILRHYVHIWCAFCYWSSCSCYRSPDSLLIPRLSDPCIISAAYSLLFFALCYSLSSLISSANPDILRKKAAKPKNSVHYFVTAYFPPKSRVGEGQWRMLRIPKIAEFISPEYYLIVSCQPTGSN